MCFLLYVFFQIVFGNDIIKFNEPDSIFISNKLNSLINTDQNLNRKYFLKHYGKNFSDIQYENLVGKMMAIFLKGILKKKLSATADIISKNLAASSVDMLKQNPDLAISDHSSKVKFNYEEAVNAKF